MLSIIVREVKRRERLFIMNQILEIAKEPVTRSYIMWSVRLSYSQMKDYIKILVGIGCLEQINQNEHIAYRTTKKGLNFVNSYNEIMSILAKYG